MATIHNVFAGNPGSGKSCLANTIIGEPVFQSGISLGSGLTSALDTHEHDGQLYSDTPGLDDISKREQAAREISAGLTSASGPGRKLRLIFVVTLEDGRVRPADVVTIEAILRAIEQSGVPPAQISNHISLIINKCSEGELSALERSPSSRDAVIRALTADYRLDDKHVFFAPRCSEGDGADNAILSSLKVSLMEFIGQAPIIQLPDVIVTLDVAHYQQRLDELMSEISGLRRVVSDMQRQGRDPTEDERYTLRQLAQTAAFAIAYGVLKRMFPAFARIDEATRPT